MARADAGLERRLVAASLWRRRGSATLAVLAIAIGASVAAALMHLSGDVGRKLSHELRALGPNLLIVPAEHTGMGTAAAGYLDAAAATHRLERAGLHGVCLLYVVTHATPAGRAIEVPVVGADLEAARRLHPAWRIGPGDPRSLVGARLAARLGAALDHPVTLRCGTRELTVAPGARLEAGSADDDAWWIPLADAQRLAGLPGLASLAQARVESEADARRAVAAIESRSGADAAPAPGLRAIVLHALSDSESDLLERMRRLMALVTAAALISAGLCAFGTLTDVALERRRDIALLKSLGASRLDVVRLFASESLAIGALGGLLGWLIGVCFAELIGRTVFHASIALRPGVPLLVLGLSIGVAAIAGLGPIRLALAVEPATALRGD